MAKEEQVAVIIAAKNNASRTISDVRSELRGLGEDSASGLGRMDRSLNNSSSRIDSYTSKLQFLDSTSKRIFKGLGAAAVAYSALSINAFLGLNDGITSVNTLYDQTAYSQQKMYKDSIEMYRNIPTDFKNITSATYNAISAGADPALASKFTKKFGKAAVAGDADMDIVTTAAMGTMNAYKLEAKDLNRVLDLQFMTVKEGITTYSELASSLGTGVLASAKGAGVSLEDLQGSIALITKNAIPANIATTSLNQLFNKFTDTKVIKEFKEYGVAIQDSHKKTRPLIEIFKDLNAQFDKKNLSSEQRKGFLKELLGSDQAARAIAPLIGDLKEFERILGSMDNSEGAMKDAFGDKLESMKVQIKLMKNNIIASGVEQLYTLTPLMEKIMEPTIKRMKLEADIDDLQEKLETTDNPYKKESISQQIEYLKLEVQAIEKTPVEELRNALAESVEELTRLNPPLAKFLDIVGNFALSFTGSVKEDSKPKTNIASKFLGGLVGTMVAANVFGGILKFGAGAVGNVKNVASLFTGGAALAKGGLETGYLKSLYAKDFVKDKFGKGGPSQMGAMLYIPKDFDIGEKHFNETWDNINELTKDVRAKIDNDKKGTKDKETPKNVYKYPNSVVKKGNNELKDISKIKSSVDLLKYDLSKGLKEMSAAERIIDNKVDLMNNVKVDVPKASINVYIDGKSIPARVVSTPQSIERSREITLRRYGNK